jgi:hypothetical protein
MSNYLKRELIPYKIGYNKVRFGKKGDGGYVVFDYNLNNINGLYSYGISDDVSFDLDFVNKHNTKVYMFDHTINTLPTYHDNFMFIKEPGNAKNFVRHINMINRDTNKLFLKMDIEGHEWDLFNEIDISYLLKFEQLVVEFHNLEFLQNQHFGNMGITYEKMSNVFCKLNTIFYLGHIHGNNCGGVKDIPNTIECTYIRKDLVPEKPEVETSVYPIPNLDYPNNNTIPDYTLDWWIK